MGYYYIISLWGYALRAPLWIYAVENSRLKIEYGCSGFNPLTPMSDWHLISPYIITPESNIKVRRIKEMIINWRSIVCSTNSPCQLLGKCIENSMENMHGDIRLWRVKSVYVGVVQNKIECLMHCHASCVEKSVTLRDITLRYAFFCETMSDSCQVILRIKTMRFALCWLLRFRISEFLLSFFNKSLCFHSGVRLYLRNKRL